MEKFKVGAGMASLDFPLEEYPVMSFSSVCEDKYDDCNLRAIAIEAGDKKVMLMCYELSDIPEVPQLEEKIAEAVGYAPDDIIITVTHNHTSPCDRGARRGATAEERQAFRERYFKLELEASIKAALAAKASLRPAKYGFGEINSYMNANEITRNSEIGYLCDENGNGYSDKVLSIIKFCDENDKLICVLLNHCTHATMAMGLDANGKYATSGNFTGIACRFVEDYFGDGVIAAWTSGAAGNQHPVFQSMYLKKAYTDGYTTVVPLPDGSEHIIMEHMGRQHGIDAINGINLITEYSDEITLSHVKDSIMIPTQKSGEDGFHSSRLNYGTGVRSNQPSPAPEFVPPETPDDPEHPAELKMELLSLGDVAIVGIGCELFCQIGRDIKAALPAKHTVVVTHTPGYVGDNPHAVGYIVDKSSLGSRNVKLFRNLKPGCYDDMIVEEALKLYNVAQNA